MKIKDQLSKFGIWAALILLSITFSITCDNFLTAPNLFNVARQVSIVGVCAVGMTFVILMGAMDLSVGAVIGISSVTAAVMMRSGLSPILATTVSLVVGTFIGLLIAFIVNKVKIVPIIVSLGMMTALRGVCYIIAEGKPIYGIPKEFLVLGQGYVSVIPMPVVIMLIIFVIGYVILEKTTIGRAVYGTGGNEDASRLSGVSVEKVKYFVFGIEGFLAALAGIILLSRVNSGQPGAGTGYEMDIITACVLGGISVTGGEGKISGVIVGVLTIGVLSNGMVLLGVNEFWQMIVKGMVLLFAVSMDKLSKSTSNKAKIQAVNS